MRKLVLSIGGTFMVLVALSLAPNSQVFAYSGIIANMPTSSPVQFVACEAKDELCEQGKNLVCQPGKEPSSPDCRCVDCGGHPACPSSASIPCGPGSCCPKPQGGWGCCPR
jgi:hypothetical protein